MLAGAAIVLVAGFVIAMISALDRGSGSGPPAPVGGVDVQPVADGPDTVDVYATSNVRTGPEATAEIVAIIPGGSPAEAIGRTAEGRWVRVAYPAGSTIRGWLPASRIAIGSEALDRLPVGAPLPSAPAVTAATAVPAADALPDLTISDVFLLQDGRLAIDIRNVGAGSLDAAEVPLTVTKVSGELLGVLRIGPTTLGPGGSATVVTPVVVSETGSYRLELDRPDEIRESQEFNNSYAALLVVSEG